MSDEIKNDFIPYYEPMTNQILWVSQVECEKIHKRVKELLHECPNFEPKDKGPRK